MEYFVYVLRSLKTNVFYKGMTSDIKRRLREHFLGKSRTTKKFLPLELVFVQIYDSRKEARVLEKFLKSGCGREIINEFCVQNMGFDLPAGRQVPSFGTQ